MADRPRCYWCNIEVFVHERIPGVDDPKDTATIDHVISRYHRKKGQETPKTLACYGCNQRRAREEDKKIAKLRKLSTSVI